MTIRDATLDNGLMAMVSQTDTIILCSIDPVSWAEANSNAVAVKSGSRGSMFYALSNYGTTGRMASLAAFIDGSITANGNANYIVVADSITQTLFITERLALPQTVQIGGAFGVDLLQVILGSATQPQAADLVVSSPAIASPLLTIPPLIAINLATFFPSIGSPILIAAETGWTNISVALQTGTFTCEFDAVPSALAVDNLLGLSDGSCLTFSDIACAILFTTTNTIVVRNGGAYAADAAVNYIANQKFHLRMVGDVSTHIYSVFVTPEGQSEVQIATNYAFRSEQSGVTQLNNFARNSSEVGIVIVSNLTLLSLIANPITVAQPVLSSPAFNGMSSLLPASLATSNPAFAILVFKQSHRIIFSPFTTSSPILSSPSVLPNTGQPAGAFNVQTGDFSIQWDAVPSQAAEDVVTGLAAAQSSTISDYACIIRFYTAGNIDVRNGSGYGATNTVPYSAGMSFHFRLNVRISNHTYDVYVTPQGQSEILLASNFAFRTDQASIASLAWLGKVITTGDVALSNMIGPPPPSLPPVVNDATMSLVTPTALNTLVGVMTATNSPTSWAINSASPSGALTWFSIDNTGAIKVTAAGVTGLGSNQGSLTLTCQANNTYGNDTGVATVNYSQIATGEQITLANTGRAGAAAAGLPNYSATLTTQAGTVNISSSATYRNINFTGAVNITGGTVLFEYCRFSYQPATALHAVTQYNGGSACGQTTFNYCDWDSGLRGATGTFECDGFGCGMRGDADNRTYNTASSFNINRCSFQGYGNMLALHKWQHNAASFVTECYFVNGITGAGTHVDFIEYYSADNIKIQRCHFEGDADILFTCIGIDLFPAYPPASNATFPITIDSNFINGAAEQIRVSEISPQVQGVYIINNRFGDAQMWGYIVDFYNWNVTFNYAYAQANPSAIYFENTNVWSSLAGAVTNPPYGTGGTGEPTQGLPHVPGAFVSQANWASMGDIPWGGSIVGPPPGGGTLTAVAFTAGSPVLPRPALNGKILVSTSGLTVASPVLGNPAVGGGGAPTFPDASNTGVPSGTVLTTYTGENPVRTSNITIEAKIFNGGLDFVNASNIIIRNCRFDNSSSTNSQWTSTTAGTSDNITYDHCEFIMNPNNSQAAAHIYQQQPCTMLINACNMRGMTHGIDCAGGPDATHRLTIQNSYFHDLASGNADPHFDCVYCPSSHVTIQNNHFDMSNWGQTSTVMFENYWGAITDLLVQNNLLRGGGYTVCARGDKSSGSVTNVRFLNNAMTTGNYGYNDFTGIQNGGRDSVTFTGNYNWVTGQPIGA